MLDELLVTFGGILMIGFLHWFFFMKKEKVVVAENEVEVIAAGGYSPEVISVERNKPTKIIFIRKDPSPCMEEVILSDFGIRRHLPLNERVTVEVTPTKEGSFSYSCGMNMYHGKILVR
jgi:plastocyanin domain-containing protein